LSGTSSEAHGCTKARFDRLLVWLHPDREEAAKEYTKIGFKLYKYLERRLMLDGHSCADAESLADDTLERVCSKMPQLADTYEGEPIRYFRGVAKNVYFEYIQRLKPEPLHGKELPAPRPNFIKEVWDRCLQKCLRHLDNADHALLLEYFEDDKKAKIDHRKALAEELGISLNTLRMRIYRLKEEVGECLSDCLEKAQEGKGSPF
jgi:DNA-directed RNA polymerase specialized sigma24 family protein